MDANPKGKIHNGADDNASGTAGVIELARYFSMNKEKEQYNFLFTCFSGEELGLIGSKKLVDSKIFDWTKVNYMINMDMIGRLMIVQINYWFMVLALLRSGEVFFRK